MKRVREFRRPIDWDRVASNRAMRDILGNPRLPKGAVLVTRDGINWTEPDKDIESVVYCKMTTGQYRRMHRNPDWSMQGTHSTVVTKRHIDHMVACDLVKRR